MQLREMCCTCTKSPAIAYAASQPTSEIPQAFEFASKPSMEGIVALIGMDALQEVRVKCSQHRAKDAAAISGTRRAWLDTQQAAGRSYSQPAPCRLLLQAGDKTGFSFEGVSPDILISSIDPVTGQQQQQQQHSTQHVHKRGPRAVLLRSDETASVDVRIAALASLYTDDRRHRWRRPTLHAPPCTRRHACRVLAVQ